MLFEGIEGGVFFEHHLVAFLCGEGFLFVSILRHLEGERQLVVLQLLMQVSVDTREGFLHLLQFPLVGQLEGGRLLVVEYRLVKRYHVLETRIFFAEVGFQTGPRVIESVFRKRVVLRGGGRYLRLRSRRRRRGYSLLH